ncbi:MAG: hypothetical protein WCR52_17525 [Bacteroidota bacterium]
MDLIQFTEEKINHYAQMIVSHPDRADELAMGQLQFYMAFRRVQQGKATLEDAGLMDAINDVLQVRGLVEVDTTFYK